MDFLHLMKHFMQHTRSAIAKKALFQSAFVLGCGIIALLIVMVILHMKIHPAFSGQLFRKHSTSV